MITKYIYNFYIKIKNTTNNYICDQLIKILMSRNESFLNWILQIDWKYYWKVCIFCKNLDKIMKCIINFNIFYPSLMNGPGK